MCVGVLPVTFFAIVLLLSPDILMTEIPDVPWAEACAAMVPESLLTLLLKGFFGGLLLASATARCWSLCAKFFVDSPLLGNRQQSVA